VLASSKYPSTSSSEIGCLNSSLLNNSSASASDKSKLSSSVKGSQASSIISSSSNSSSEISSSASTSSTGSSTTSGCDSTDGSGSTIGSTGHSASGKHPASTFASTGIITGASSFSPSTLTLIITFSFKDSTSISLVSCSSSLSNCHIFCTLVMPLFLRYVFKVSSFSLSTAR
jgi:hypothetical protein